jgi:hypothetical protein
VAAYDTLESMSDTPTHNYLLPGVPLALGSHDDPGAETLFAAPFTIACPRPLARERPVIARDLPSASGLGFSKLTNFENRGFHEKIEGAR